MKTGILTFHHAKNYGAILQTFALQTTLKEMGANPYIIDRYTVGKTIIHRIYHTFDPRLILHRLSWSVFDQFSKKYLIPKTKKYKTINSLKYFEQKEKLDACIVGSDQVWRMEFSAIGYNYFFDFIKDSNIRKISYAASFGKEKWKENESVTTHVKQLLKNFNSISVREKSGVKICSDIFDVNATHVIDPTLLLKREVYESIFLNDYPEKMNATLVTYVLGNPDAAKYCHKFSKECDLDYVDLYYVPHINKFFLALKYGIKHYLHISVPEWLWQIKSAKYVVTNSFHATIFSILFGKQFIVVDHPSGGTSRIDSLLELLGLQDRFVKNISDISLELFQKKIDFDSVYSKIDVEKNQSILFLQNALFK